MTRLLDFLAIGAVAGVALVLAYVGGILVVRAHEERSRDRNKTVVRRILDGDRR